MIRFYDTSSLINLFEQARFEVKGRDAESIWFASETWEELNSLKNTNSTARLIIREVAQNPSVFFITGPASRDGTSIASGFDLAEQFKNYPILNKVVDRYNLTTDSKIVLTALDLCENYGHSGFCFYTSDWHQYYLGHALLGGSCQYYHPPQPPSPYEGCRVIQMQDAEMALFYENYDNIWSIGENQYMLIQNEDGRIVDKLKFSQGKFEPLKYKTFESKYFKRVKPMHNDPYQACLCDSLSHNKITLVKGPAGSGKTFLSLGYALHQLEQGEVERIVIFCNTVATANSAKLGFYPGTKDEKLLDSQIGNLLTSKLGGKNELECLIKSGQIVLLPMSDIRGYDTSGVPSVVYISEAQNLDISLMKLALQRIGEDSVCIIDGDCNAQVDHVSFMGKNNGMKRVSEVFQNTDIYGEVELKNIYRSRIADIAETM